MKENKQNFKILYLNGCFSSMQDTFVTGTMLIYFATLFNASNITIGILTSIPYLTIFMSIFAGYLANKGIKCKNICIISSLISKPMYLLIMLLPLLSNTKQALTFLFIFSCFLYIPGGVTSGAFNIWLKKLLPENTMGLIIANRFKYMMVTQFFCYILTYFLLKNIKGINTELEIKTYQILFFLTFLAGICIILTFFKLQETPKIQNHDNFINAIKKTFNNKPFMILFFNMNFFYFFAKLMIPYITVFLIKNLGFGLEKIVVISCIILLSYVLSTNYWGEISDKYGPKQALKKSLFLLLILAVGFAVIAILNMQMSNLLYGIIIILNILNGIAQAGLQISLQDILINYTTNKNYNAEISILNGAKSVCQGLGLIFAGFLITLIAKFQSIFHSLPQNDWCVFFVICTILIACCLPISNKIEKINYLK